MFIHQIADGWQAVAEDMFTGPDALVIANTLQQAMDNIRRTMREPGFWKVIEKYTAFFSTYATMKPGFHVRNAMSGHVHEHGRRREDPQHAQGPRHLA